MPWANALAAACMLLLMLTSGAAWGRFPGGGVATAVVGLQSSVITVVNITDQSDPLKLAVQAAAGLANREGPNVFVLAMNHDAMWQGRLLADYTQQYVDPIAFVNASLGQWRAIRYTSGEGFYPFLPSVVTMAGVLDSVPIDDELFSMFPTAEVSLDTRGMWSRAEEAVNYTIANALNLTSSLCFHPGRDIAFGGDVDWILARRLFTQFLNNSCIPDTEHNVIFKRLVHEAPWPRPVRVYGYNSQDLFLGGYLFEAETDCVKSMGQIATSGATNLAFWAQLNPFNASAPRGTPSGPLTQPALVRVPYNESKRYVALVYGDMDNIGFVQTFGSTHMEYRSSVCSAHPERCFPLSWTLSPNLIDFGPEMMRWYFRKGAMSSGLDHFVMPPSGTLYSYPGMMTPEVQAFYVQQQNEQARVMDTSGSVHWEWFFDWDAAFENYFPRYENCTECTRTFLLNEVPWVLPIPGLTAKGEYFKIIGSPTSDGSVVAFRPAFNWEPTGNGGVALNASECAWVINNFEPGSVQYIYMIQNSGIRTVFDMVGMLDRNEVQLVSYAQLADLARQKASLDHAGHK